MIANGLTKALSRSEFHKFLQRVNLVNIASQIVEREIRESKQEELNHNSLQVYMGDIIKRAKRALLIVRFLCVVLINVLINYGACSLNVHVTLTCGPTKLPATFFATLA